MQTDILRKKLLTWFSKQKRQLPWRGTRDPYRVWVSEVMLQQTTVAAVRTRYDRFLARFPTLPALARAREESVLAEWSGLGYYARARNLRRAAAIVVRTHGGRLPESTAALRRLPGFGEYMAAAVASLAYGARVPAIDANVTRVLSRLFAIDGIAGRRAHRAAVENAARRLLSRGRPELLTPALMDLGQLTCLPRHPLCAACPLNTDCEALRRGVPDTYPRRPARPAPVAVFLAAAVIRWQGRALLVRRRTSYLDGLWEFPCGEGPTRASARRVLGQRARELGLSIERAARTTVRHSIVNRRLTIEVLSASRNPKSKTRAAQRSAASQSRIQNPKPQAARWFSSKELERAAIPTLTRKVARAAGVLD